MRSRENKKKNGHVCGVVFTETIEYVIIWIVDDKKWVWSFCLLVNLI